MKLIDLINELSTLRAAIADHTGDTACANNFRVIIDDIDFDAVHDVSLPILAVLDANEGGLQDIEACKLSDDLLDAPPGEKRGSFVIVIRAKEN